MPGKVIDYLDAAQNATITGNWTFDGTTGITLKAITAGSVNGIYAGSDTLLRFWTAAAGAGGQSDGKNLFVGGAGNSTMTNGAGAVSLASWNTAIGYGAFAANTTGYFNVALGYNALAANTTGAANVAIGTQALLGTTTGYHNTAIGYRALYQNTEGSSNTAFGFNTLSSAITANFNTGIGDGVLAVCTVSENSGVGYQALNACTTGAQNVAMGNGAGLLLTQGATNVLIGYLAGVTGGSYANALTTGSNNVWLGANCGSSSTSQYSNTIALGAGALVSASNTCRIGNSSMLTVSTAGQFLARGSLDYALPEFAFVTDPDTGLAWREANVLSLVAGGFEAARLDTSNGFALMYGTYKIGATQVVGAQGAAVADATGAGDVVAQLNALLARLRTHGLIAT